MNVIDFAIAAVALLALVDGARGGLFVTFGKYAGGAAGLLLGGLLGAALVDQFDLSRTPEGFLVAASAVVLLIIVGYSIGVVLGTPIRQLLAATRVTGAIDAGLGALLSVLIVLFVAWAMARVLDRGPNSTTAELVQQSKLVRTLDDVAPGSPPFIGRLEDLIASNFGPDVFAGLEPSLPKSIGIDASTAAAPAVRNAAQHVTRIESRGCGGFLFGSGFPIAPDEIMTNAHVVAGATVTGVRTTDGQLHQATLILFDPARDVAVLRVPGLDAQPFQFADGDRGTGGAVIGYPGGGKEQVAPAVLDGEITANGTDIFNDSQVRRDVWVVEGQVLPGNSGGPFVDTNGNVVGVVFARSLSDSGKGFALTPDEFATDLDSLQSGEPIMGPGQDRCAD